MIIPQKNKNAKRCPKAPLPGELSAKLTERLSPNSENLRRCAPLGSPERGAVSAQPRLRGCRRFATAGCLRRPYLFRLAGKDREEKGRLGYVWCFLHLNSGRNQRFRLAFHSTVTSRMSDYAPPDTGVSNLQLVAFEYLQSIEGAACVCQAAPFCIGFYYLLRTL